MCSTTLLDNPDAWTVTTPQTSLTHLQWIHEMETALFWFICEIMYSWVSLLKWHFPNRKQHPVSLECFVELFNWFALSFNWLQDFRESVVMQAKSSRTVWRDELWDIKEKVSGSGLKGTAHSVLEWNNWQICLLTCFIRTHPDNWKQHWKACVWCTAFFFFFYLVFGPFKYKYTT